MIALGHALCIDYKSIAIYSEALIRSNIIYHCANLLECADFYICTRLHLPPFIAISTGIANGVVRKVERCEMLLRTKTEPRDIIGIVDEVQGDEEFSEYHSLCLVL